MQDTALTWLCDVFQGTWSAEDIAWSNGKCKKTSLGEGLLVLVFFMFSIKYIVSNWVETVQSRCWHKQKTQSSLTALFKGYGPLSLSCCAFTFISSLPPPPFNTLCWDALTPGCWRSRRSPGEWPGASRTPAHLGRGTIVMMKRWYGSDWNRLSSHCYS